MKEENHKLIKKLNLKKKKLDDAEEKLTRYERSI